MRSFITFALLPSIARASYNPTAQTPFQADSTNGAYPQDFAVIGPPLEAIHESQQAPTGLAVSNCNSNSTSPNLYLTYPRNSGLTPNNVVFATGFNTETPWPTSSIQNCTYNQDPSTCFINVQNIILDSIGQLWIIDSGISYNSSDKTAIVGGAKIMSFNATTSELIRVYAFPEEVLAEGMNANDLRINNTLGTEGFGFVTDASAFGSLLAINLDTGDVSRRLFNTSVVRADEKYVGSFNGQPVYSWKGTQKSYITTGADGIALQSGNLYWSVLGSRRFYYIPQNILANFSATDQEILDAVVFPSQCATEQAGLTADDKGRLYITASEQNAIYYIDTLQSKVQEEVNGVKPGGNGLVEPENYVVKTLVRSALIQHADSAAILDGYLYFCTNQLELSPGLQYNNTDRRMGPFRSYRVWIGRGPAV